jgi:hypothetical protein
MGKRMTPAEHERLVRQIEAGQNALTPEQQKFEDVRQQVETDVAKLEQVEVDAGWDELNRLLADHAPARKAGLPADAQEVEPGKFVRLNRRTHRLEPC